MNSNLGYKIKRHVRTDRFKWIVIFLTVTLLSVGLIGVTVKLNRQVTKDSLGALDYKIGTLNATGVYASNTGKIVSKDYNTTNGLEVKIKSGAQVTYKLNFYDEGKDFISASAVEQSADLIASAIPATAKYFKIVITPTADAEVSLWEIKEYAGQIVVTFDK